MTRVIPVVLQLINAQCWLIEEEALGGVVVG